MYLIWSVVWSIWYYLCYKISLYSTFVKIYICMIIFNLKGKVWMVLKMPLNPQNTKNLYRYSLFYCNVVWYKVHTHTHPFNGPLSGTTRVSQYQKGKPIWILLKQETVSGDGISWAICKSAPCSRQIPHQLLTAQFFYRPDALPAAQPTASKHLRQLVQSTCILILYLSVTC